MKCVPLEARPRSKFRETNLKHSLAALLGKSNGKDVNTSQAESFIMSLLTQEYYRRCWLPDLCLKTCFLEKCLSKSILWQNWKVVNYQFASVRF